MKHLLLSLLVAVGINASTASAQTLQECANFAHLYCTKFFSTCFEGRRYQQVVVNQSHVLSANTIGMAGTVTFLDALGLSKSNYFELMMTVTPYNTVEVKFAKLNQLFGSQYWEYCNQSIPLPPPQQASTNTSPQQRPLTPGEVSLKQTQIQNTINATLMYSQRMVNSSGNW